MESAIPERKLEIKSERREESLAYWRKTQRCDQIEVLRVLTDCWGVG